jgi:hypothetical protein
MHQRAALQELRHQLAQHRLGQCHGTAHADGAARLGLHLGHGVGRGQRRIAHGLAVAQVGLAHLRQRQLARGALQQAYAQPAFQLGHAPRKP